ncbi:MAG: hypothetical protein Q8R76_01480 [Candidatus Omnitrophota bacterium]|nr:hypothetical protein [Candidatus Omnitrophota bacterium]
MSNTRLSILSVLLLIILPMLIFWRAQQYDFVNWDDDLYVYNNPMVRSFEPDNVKAWFTKPYIGMYVPLTLASYALDDMLYGVSAQGYHRTGLILHIINGVLVFLLLRRMFGCVVAPLAGALLFSLHPVQVESVIWISQRKSLLFSFFFLLGLFTWSGSPGKVEGEKRRLFWGTVLFVAAILSKITAVVIPLVYFSYDYFFEKQRLARRSAWYLAFLILAAVLGIVTLALYPDVLRVGDMAAIKAHAAHQLSALALYLQLIVWPSDLDLFYAVPPAVAGNLLGLLTVGGVLLFLMGVFLSVRWKMTIGFWGCWTLFFLVPVCSLFRVPVGDRHLYMPLVGMIGLLLMILKSRPRLAAALLFAAVMACAPISYARTAVWQNGGTLWESVKVRGDFYYRIGVHMARHYEDAGESEKAIAVYRKVIDAHWKYLPYAHINLYGLYRDQGDFAGAQELALRFKMEFGNDFDLESIYTTLLTLKPDPQKVRSYLHGLFGDNV